MSILSQYKPKRLLTIGFAVLYMLVMVFSAPYTESLRYSLRVFIAFLPTLICPALVIAFFLCRIPRYWILTVGFGITAIRAAFSLFYSMDSLLPYLNNSAVLLSFIGSCLQTALLICMFVATFLPPRFRPLLKYSALAYVLVYTAILLIEFIANLATGYFEKVPSDYSSVNIAALIRAVANILFYFGIFLSSETTSSADA